MRTNKFRAWDPKEKQWWGELIFVRAIDGICMVEIGSYEPAQECDFTLVQFINKLDKDDKEIYEGDILEDHYWNEMWFTENIKVEMPSIYGWLDSHKIVKGSYYKIIGNIYNNPKLKRISV